MCAYKTDPYQPKSIIDLYYQPVTIAFNIEHDPVIRQKTGCRVKPLNIHRSHPIG